MKVFYDSIRNLEIVDVSSNKSLGEIKQSFGEANYFQSQIGFKEVFVVDGSGPRVEAVVTIQKTQEEILIDKKIIELANTQAIEVLKTEGKIPIDYKDK